MKMKKLALLVGIGLFLSTPALAGWGDGSGKCDWSHKKQKTASYQHNSDKVVIERNGQLLEVVSTSEQPIYNVKNTKGEVLAHKISKEILASNFPELYKALEG